jgi:hypothetical protein
MMSRVHYTNENMTNDEMQRMPWTRDLMTTEEFWAWIATRPATGANIDIETCELGHWKADDFAPYGDRRRRLDDDHLYDQIGTNRFVRSPESDGWVHEGDLPPEKIKAMYDRIRREFEVESS